MVQGYGGEHSGDQSEDLARPEASIGGRHAIWAPNYPDWALNPQGKLLPLW
jgi:hypothetical protein